MEGGREKIVLSKQTILEALETRGKKEGRGSLVKDVRKDEQRAKMSTTHLGKLTQAGEICQICMHLNERTQKGRLYEA